MIARLVDGARKFKAEVILPGDKVPMVLVWGERVYYWGGSGIAGPDGYVLFVETTVHFVAPGSVVRVEPG